MTGKRWGRGDGWPKGAFPSPLKHSSLQPLRIIGVRVHPGQRKDQILLDLNIR